MYKKEKKRIAVVNCFIAWESRVELIVDYFENVGNEVTVYYSDFNHMKKQYYKLNKINYKLVHTLSYKKNLSVARLLSHYFFSKSTFNQISTEDYDLVYVLAPPNSLVREAKKTKDKKHFKLVFDLIDMWPESFPIKRFKNNIFFRVWANLRNRNINDADHIFTECDYFNDCLATTLDSDKQSTLYWSLHDNGVKILQPKTFDTLHLLYLGSINHIIDIDLIVSFSAACNRLKPVLVEIVGDGENRDLLLRELEKNNIKYKYHGKIYDLDEKNEIFNRIHFAFNIMKNSVNVGLTMKSIEYFMFGLPLINNIQGDTFDIIEKNKNGYNINYLNINEIAEYVCSINEVNHRVLKKTSRNVYDKLFSVNVFNNSIHRHIQNIFNN